MQGNSTQILKCREIQHDLKMQGNSTRFKNAGKFNKN
jgi:hypothetical protein